jgi:hypothetical protein
VASDRNKTNSLRSNIVQGHRGARRDSHSKDYLLRAVREHKKESGFPQKQKALRNMQRAFHLL